MVRHMDAEFGGQEPELHVPVDGPHRQPRGERSVAEWFGEAPANEKSCALTADKEHCDIFHADDEEFFDQIEYWKTPVADCGDDRGEECKTYDEWVQGWTEVKG